MQFVIVRLSVPGSPGNASWRERGWLVRRLPVLHEHRGEKKYRILGNAPWVHQLRMPCKCPPEVEHLSLTKTRNGKRYGNLRVLKASQIYPEDMGRAVVEAWCGNQLVSPGSTGVSSTTPSRPLSTPYQVADGALAATPRDRSRSPSGHVSKDKDLLADLSDRDLDLLGDDKDLLGDDDSDDGPDSDVSEPLFLDDEVVEEWGNMQ